MRFPLEVPESAGVDEDLSPEPESLVVVEELAAAPSDDEEPFSEDVEVESPALVLDDAPERLSFL